MSQFMEVIEWFDQTGTAIVQRYPEDGSGDIKMGAQLIVRENQAAVFFRDGQALDVFGPGRHTLSTQNLPILTRLLSLPWGFQSPFRAEVYFVNLKVFTNMRWGTRDPVAFKDSQLGLIRLRAFGSFTMRVTQPLLFVNSLVGTQGSYTTDQIEDYLREVIVARLNDFLGETVQSLLELPRQYDEMAVALKTRLAEEFRKYGTEMVDFYINRITPPEDVERMIDERSSMGAVGDLDRFLKFKAAKAMGDAAGTAAGANGGDGTEGPGGPGASGGGGSGNGGAAPSGNGGGAAAGLGVGIGAGLGMMLPGMLLRTAGGKPVTTAGLVERGFGDCPECHGEVSLASRFCPHCGHQLVVVRKCPRCDKNLTAQANFCPACGLDMKSELHCARCETRLPPGTRYCFHCGERVGEAAAPGGSMRPQVESSGGREGPLPGTPSSPTHRPTAAR